jgi:hypothetical protein
MFFKHKFLSFSVLNLYFKSNEKLISTFYIPTALTILSITLYKNVESYNPFVTVEYLQSLFFDFFKTYSIITSIKSKKDY